MGPFALWVAASEQGEANWNCQAKGSTRDPIAVPSRVARQTRTTHISCTSTGGWGWGVGLGGVLRSQNGETDTPSLLSRPSGIALGTAPRTQNPKETQHKRLGSAFYIAV